MALKQGFGLPGLFHRCPPLVEHKQPKAHEAWVQAHATRIHGDLAGGEGVAP
jgi:hypothetical protein